MARPRTHEPDEVLDQARRLVLDGGVRAATIEAIASASGAPVGSLYHHFKSRDGLLARLWVRAVRRSQAAFRAAAQHPDPEQGAIAAALSIYDFCAQQMEDARLLVSMRREDLLKAELPADIADELNKLNEPVRETLEQLSLRLYQRALPSDYDRLLLATFDLPYSLVRRYVIRGQKPPPHRRKLLKVAILAVIRAA